MGLLDYAWSIFFEKDHIKTKLLISSKYKFSQLLRDEAGLAVILPEPKTIENEEGERTLSLMGYNFPANNLGKIQLANLFRAAVTHLGAHVVSSNFDDYEEWKKRKDLKLARFTASILEDVQANVYVSSLHADRLGDLAFANTLGLRRLRRLDKIVNPATRLMTSLLVEINTGLISKEKKSDCKVVARLVEHLELFKKDAANYVQSQKESLNEIKTKVADEIYYAAENAGATTECPFFPHTEELGPCSVFSPSCFVESDVTSEGNFARCLEHLGGNLGSYENEKQAKRKIAEAEATQILDSWQRQKEKDERLVARYGNMLSTTKFRSVEIPEQDYTEYLRIRGRCKSEAHRLIESLLVARDALDEDPRKVYGVLDLQEVIQVIASKSPRMDVFMLDENLSKSYSWVILLDASKSMKHIKDFAMELLMLLAEVANSLLMDPTSWGMYAFNDRFLIIKDPKERYNAKVKSRIGGINFEGFTYMPDALKLGGQIIKTRAENLRLITIISDGWPCGYAEMNTTLAETLGNLLGRSINVIAIGAKSRQMQSLFKSCSTVYTLRDLTKKFSNLYLDASRVAAET